MLWRLFNGGECRDIVEEHILPKLNRTDEILVWSEYGDEKVD